MLRTILIDDEAHNRDTLRKLLEMHCPQVSVIGEASGVAEGIKAIRKLQPELVFLDVNMKDGSGFDLLNAVEARDFKVIFISACEKDTVKAFNSGNSEYLNKPVNPVELMLAVRNAKGSAH